jgi:alkylation response protein AidB-like acyl-CoA dehydrogenase
MARTVDEARFDALRNAIYHSSRRGFFETVNRMLNFFIIGGGTAAVADIGDSWGIDPAWFAAVAALGGVLQLVFDFGGRARTHEFLQRRFYELAAEIAESQAPTEDQIRAWDGDLNRLYAEEPPPMRALDAIAYNAAVDALGRGADKRIPLRWWHSLLRHFWPFNEKAF